MPCLSEVYMPQGNQENNLTEQVRQLQANLGSIGAQLASLIFGIAQGGTPSTVTVHNFTVNNLSPAMTRIETIMRELSTLTNTLNFQMTENGQFAPETVNEFQRIIDSARELIIELQNSTTGSQRRSTRSLSFLNASQDARTPLSTVLNDTIDLLESLALQVSENANSATQRPH